MRERFEPYFLLAPEANIAVAAAVLTPGIKNITTHKSGHDSRASEPDRHSEHY